MLGADADLCGSMLATGLQGLWTIPLFLPALLALHFSKESVKEGRKERKKAGIKTKQFGHVASVSTLALIVVPHIVSLIIPFSSFPIDSLRLFLSFPFVLPWS